MLFSHPIFLFAFLPSVLLLYFIAPLRARNIVLIIASLFFYAWGELQYTALLLASIGVNFGLGLAIDDAESRRRKLYYLILGVALNLGAVMIFKYLGFAIDNVNALFDTQVLQPREMHLPLGVSFFTFMSMSYLVDVYRGTCPSERSLERYALYISLFPHLIAGPIVRHIEIAEQLKHRKVSADDFSEGVSRFIIGLGKKVILADTLAITVDEIMVLPVDSLSMGIAWVGIIGYTLQIYLDFSGYADMAIGMARMFGFHFPENFNYPYLATSIKDFWRRWHMTLSRWFRDYLYISLGGGRVSPIRVYANLIVVFVLVGLWHGANWNFIVWGLFHGAFLVLERLGLGRLIEWLPRPLRHAYVLTVITVGWAFFRIEDFSHSISYIEAMFNFAGVADNIFLQSLDGEFWAAMAVGIAVSLRLGPWLYESLHPRLWHWPLGLIRELFLVGTLFLGLIYVAGSTYTPFIYFRF